MINDPILIVDDEVEVRSGLQEALSRRGYIVDTAASWEEALKAMDQREFHVVLTDLHMHGTLTGLDLLAAIRQRHPDTLCIVITGYATLDTSLEAMKRGAYDLIQKPFRLSEVEVVLDRALDHGRLLRKVRAYQEELESRILARTRELRAAHRTALDLCDLSLQALAVGSLEEALAPLLDRLQATWQPDGLALYRAGAERTLGCVAQRGSRTLPTSLTPPDPGPLPAPGFGYREEMLLPLGSTGWLYLGFEDRPSLVPDDPGFLLLARHLELVLQVR
jgi:ActR/RegA family two-component response regulator